MNNIYTIESLKTMNRCNLNREFQMRKPAKEIPEVLASHFCVDLLKDILFNRVSKNDVLPQIEAFYDTLDFPSEKTRIDKRNDMMACIERYLNCENRLLMEGQAAVADIYGVNVNIVPDAIYYDQNNGVMEIIKYYYKKPDITQNGRKQDHCVTHHMGLYSLLWYGEHMLPQNFTCSVRASIYFLKKADEKPDTMNPDFFDADGKNIISMECSYTGGTNTLSFWDAKYKSIFEEFVSGKNAEYDKEYCKYCSMSGVCSYKELPKEVPLIKNISNVNQIPYNAEQLKAINHMNGLARINAGAGTGKTLTVAARTVNLILNGVLPKEICLLTFTDSGAREMKERILLFLTQLGIPAKEEDFIITTFNGFGNDIIEKHYEKLGYEKVPRLADDVERFSIISELLRDTDIPGLDYRNFKLQSKYVKGALPFAKKVIDMIKSRELSNDDSGYAEVLRLLKREHMEAEEDTIKEIFKVYEKYEQIMRMECLIDYTDQENLLFKLFQVYPVLFEELGFKHIIVDEFQDSNERQVNIMKLLCSASSYKSLMVVGDDAQSIYSFRDTTPEYIINFYKYMGMQGTDYFLLENHRSTPEIIDFANKINDRNIHKIDKRLVSKKAHGDTVKVQSFVRKESEYAFIRNMFINEHRNGVAYEDMAFIASTKSELMKMKTLLDREKIPCILLNPELMLENPLIIAALDIIRFFEEPEYEQGVITYLNVLYDNKIILKNKKEIEKAVVYYKKYATENFTKLNERQKVEFIFVLLNKLATREDEIFESFYEILKDKKTWGKLLKYHHDFMTYGENNAKKRENHYDGIVLTTAHSSKGLEWKSVALSLSGFDSEDLHLKENEDLLEEKRRLFFVAATRAKERLSVTGQYMGFGKAADRNFNVFMQEAYDICGKDLVQEYDDNKNY